MKQQNDPKKTNYYSPYGIKKASHQRKQEIINSIPERCWWLKQYLRGIYLNSGPKGRR